MLEEALTPSHLTFRWVWLVKNQECGMEVKSSSIDSHTIKVTEGPPKKAQILGTRPRQESILIAQ